MVGTDATWVTLAPAGVAAGVDAGAGAGVDAAAYPKIAAWSEAILSRPSMAPWIAKEERLIEQLLQRKPEAIVVTGGRHTPRAEKLLRGAGIPVIETWDLPEAPIDQFGGQRVAGGAGNREVEPRVGGLDLAVARLGVAALDQWQVIDVPAGDNVTRCLVVGSDAPELHRFRVQLGEGASAAFFVTNAGGDYTRVEIEVHLARGAHFEFGGVTVGGRDTVREFVTRVIHADPAQPYLPEPMRSARAADGACVAAGVPLTICGRASLAAEAGRAGIASRAAASWRTACAKRLRIRAACRAKCF